MPTKSVRLNRVLERDVQKAILDYCKAERIFVRRRNVAGKQRLSGGHYVNLGTRGMSDLWGIAKNGRHWECEVKRPGEKPTVEQESWLKECALSDAYAFWVDSLDEFIELIRRIV